MRMVLVCARVGAEVCVCAHVCMKSEICISALVCMPACVCVLFQWWQTAEVLFPEESDNLSSGESVSTFLNLLAATSTNWAAVQVYVWITIQ